MNDDPILRGIEGLRAREVEWSELREARVWQRIEGELARDETESTATFTASEPKSQAARSRARHWPVLSALALAAAVLLAWLTTKPDTALDRPGIAPSQTAASGASVPSNLPLIVEFSDQSSAHGYGKLSVKRDEARAIEVEQQSGDVLYTVSKRAERDFVVHIGDSTRVEVVGTTFWVRMPAAVRATAEVELLEGRVRIVHAGEVQILRPGEVWQGPATTLAQRDEPPLPSKPQVQSPDRTRASKRSSSKPPRSAKLPKSPKSSKSQPDDIESLLQAARRHRLAGRQRQAVDLLQRALPLARDRDEAASIQFKSAKLFQDLGRARTAARTFERSYAEAPKGVLAEEALARAVKTWAKLGQQAQAQRVLLRYRQRFPEGVYLKELTPLVVGTQL